MSARDTTISGIRWDGKPLPGLLDAVTSRLGLSWTFRDGAVQIHYLDTRVFRIYAIQSKTNMQSVVQSGTQLASSGTSGQVPPAPRLLRLRREHRVRRLHTDDDGFD